MPIPRSPQQHQHRVSTRSGSCTSDTQSPALSGKDAPHDQISTDSSSGEGSRGAVAAAILTLPIDVGTVVSPTIVSTPVNNGSRCKGGPGNPSCNLEVKGTQLWVECDICKSWYHALCQAISKSAYNALQKFDVVAFICSMCRRMPNLDNLQPRAPTKEAAIQASFHEQNAPAAHTDTGCETDNCGGRSDLNTMSQLVSKVDSLERALKDHIKDMTNQIQSLHTHSSPGDRELLETRRVGREQTYAQALIGTATEPEQGRPAPQSSNMEVRTNSQHQATQQRHHTQEYRMMVREELLELDERKKRRSSLFIRGLRAASTAEASAKFAEVTESLFGEKVVLSETCRIRNDADLYRGNVHNNRQRKLILEQAKTLKNSSFSHVYIKKDLTYMQRMELQARFREHQARPKSSITVSIPGQAQRTISAPPNSSPVDGSAGRDRGDGPDHTEPPPITEPPMEAPTEAPTSATSPTDQSTTGTDTETASAPAGSDNPACEPTATDRHPVSEGPIHDERPSNDPPDAQRGN